MKKVIITSIALILLALLISLVQKSPMPNKCPDAEISLTKC